MTIKKINFDSFPPLGLLPDSITSLIEKRAELVGRADVIGARLIELVTGSAGADAADADRLATVTAIEAGGTEPVSEARSAFNAEVAAVRRESTALHNTIEDLNARIISTITEEAPAILSSIPDMRDKAHRNYARAIEALNTARAAYHHQSEFKRWAELFTSDGETNLAVFIDDDPGLVIRHNRPGEATYSHDEIHDAYRHDLEEREVTPSTNPWK